MSELLDQGLALTIAGRIGGVADSDVERDAERLGRVDRKARERILAYTGLQLQEEPPPARWVSRREWIEINLAGFGRLIDLAGERLHEGISLPDPLVRVTDGVLGRVLALEAGAVLGLASRRVLGQYEFPLLGGGEPRLLFVADNLAPAAAALGATEEELLEWVALHECTHALHFSAAPWMREHVASSVRGLLEESEMGAGLGDLLALGRRLVSEDPRKLAGELMRRDPAALLASPASRERIETMRSVMAAVEGYAEHVMDRAAPGELRTGELRTSLDRRRRERGPLARLLGWLLGFEAKLEQYEAGKRFCDEVADSTGVETLNRAWEAPDLLPDRDEIYAPDAWLERVGEAAVAA